jgi:hypothetical protein
MEVPSDGSPVCRSCCAVHRRAPADAGALRCVVAVCYRVLTARPRAIGPDRFMLNAPG